MVVTAFIPDDDLTFFHHLRQQHFPGHRNFLSAHLTLFHYIKPAQRLPLIEFTRQYFNDWSPFSVKVLSPFSLGRGVAYGLEPTPLIALREPLRKRFAPHLKPQDARPWKSPHITVQNKVAPEAAQALLAKLTRDPAPKTIDIIGLQFHRYDGGPWTLLKAFTFDA